jgi:hypothetical protein
VRKQRANGRGQSKPVLPYRKPGKVSITRDRCRAWGPEPVGIPRRSGLSEALLMVFPSGNGDPKQVSFTNTECQKSCPFDRSWVAEVRLHFERRGAVESSFRRPPPPCRSATHSVRTPGNHHDLPRCGRLPIHDTALRYSGTLSEAICSTFRQLGACGTRGLLVSGRHRVVCSVHPGALSPRPRREATSRVRVRRTLIAPG